MTAENKLPEKISLDRYVENMSLLNPDYEFKPVFDLVWRIWMVEKTNELGEDTVRLPIPKDRVIIPEDPELK